MRLRQIAVGSAVLGLLCVPAHADSRGYRDISRDVLAADDGWAAYGTGTTGGSTADDAHVYTVTDRAGLARALDNGSDTPSHIEVADLVKSWNGTALHQTGTLFNGCPVDLLAIYNAYNSGSERDLTADVGWTPTLHAKIDSAEAADREAARGAGAERIP
jgi:pectate lyase